MWNYLFSSYADDATLFVTGMSFELKTEIESISQWYMYNNLKTIVGKFSLSLSLSLFHNRGLDNKIKHINKGALRTVCVSLLVW